MGIHGPKRFTGHPRIELKRLWFQRGEIKSQPDEFWQTFPATLLRLVGTADTAGVYEKTMMHNGR